MADKLSPAPWHIHAATETVCDSGGGAVLHVFHGGTPETRAQAHRDAEFIALARNAYDVMLWRGWFPCLLQSGWTVSYGGAGNNSFPWCEYEKQSGRLAFWDCPFAALVAADAWLRGQEGG